MAIPPIASSEPPYHELLEEHCLFLSRDRGLAETTVTNYRRYLRDFLASRGDAVNPTELTQLTADDLLARNEDSPDADSFNLKRLSRSGPV